MSRGEIDMQQHDSSSTERIIITIQQTHWYDMFYRLDNVLQNGKINRRKKLSKLHFLQLAFAEHSLFQL